MAVLHRKEEKIQAVLGRLPKKYSPDDFVAMFIKLYSKDWGKIKSAYIKASQDKEPGTIIHMPKPELYLKQVLEIFLTQQPIVVAAPTSEITESKPGKVKKTAAAKPETPIKKTSTVKKESTARKQKAVVTESAAKKSKKSN